MPEMLSLSDRLLLLYFESVKELSELPKMKAGEEKAYLE
jgi:hypothetical protein